eukprot:7184523-Prymnesium_polylepis.1
MHNRCPPCWWPMADGGARGRSSARGSSDYPGTRYGLWPMMRREAVTGATRTLRCRGWHEVCVDARTG